MADGRRGGTALPGEMLERCGRFGDHFARWVAVTSRPGEDIEPGSPTGRVVIGLRDVWEAELRWLEANPARTEEEAAAKLAVARALVGVSGSPGFAPRYHLFLLQAQEERGSVPAGRRARFAGSRAWRGWTGFLR